jgi:hypothetical protein
MSGAAASPAVDDAPSQQDHDLYCSMEYLPGGSLAQLAEPVTRQATLAAVIICLTSHSIGAF